MTTFGNVTQLFHQMESLILTVELKTVHVPLVISLAKPHKSMLLLASSMVSTGH